MANNTDQLNMKDYQFKEVKVRMYLKEGDTLYSQDPVNTSNAAVSLMREYLKDFDREAVCTLNLDSQMKPINFNIVSLGDLNSSIIHPREVFKSAILSNAAAVIMFHNHPSGDVTPSNQDIDATRRIAEAGQILGINLLDHVIAAGGKQSYFSFSNSMTELLHGPVHTDSIPQSIKAKEEETKYKGGKTIMEERKDREKDQAGERKKVYITLNKAFCYQRESETTGRIYNQMIMPKGTLLDGRDIGGYKIAPAFMEQSKYNPNEMVATYYVPADKPLKVKLIKGADFEEVDIEKIKEAVDDQKTAYREALKEKEKEAAAEKAPKSVLRKEKDRGEEL